MCPNKLCLPRHGSPCLSPSFEPRRPSHVHSPSLSTLLNDLAEEAAAAVDLDFLLDTARTLIRIPSWAGNESDAQRAVAQIMADIKQGHALSYERMTCLESLALTEEVAEGKVLSSQGMNTLHREPLCPFKHSISMPPSVLLFANWPAWLGRSR